MKPDASEGEVTLRVVSQWTPGRAALHSLRAIPPPPPILPREIGNLAYFGGALGWRYFAGALGWRIFTEH